MTYELSARAVLVLSNSGRSAATLVSARPGAPVVAITNNINVYRRLALLWSVIPVLKNEAGKMNPNRLAKLVALELGLAKKEQYVLLVRGFHSDPELNTPTITALAMT